MARHHDIQLGTIIPSILDFDSFKDVHRDNGEFNANTSKFAPVDGRSIAGSDLQTHYGQDKVPDFRGVFLRGLNSFDSEYNVEVPAGRKDPDERGVGQFQDDAFESHTHGSGSLSGSTNKGGEHAHELRYYRQRLHNNFQGIEQGHTMTKIGDEDIPKKTKSYDSGAHRHNFEVTDGRTGSTGSTETRPKNVAIYYYVKINN